MKEIYLAGGCFWGTEKYFESLKGVEATEVGYANGVFKDPSYQDLKHGLADEAEAVKVVYDERQISLSKLLEHLLRFVDPFALDHQGEDYGHQYRTGVFFLTPEDGKEAGTYLKAQEKKAGKPFKIALEPLKVFYPAEEYHQKYLDKNPGGYCHVNLGLIKKEERK
jgi:methionine-S-sulfoxide reductase